MTDAALAGLAREVEALRRLVDERGGLRSKVDSLASSVEHLTSLVGTSPANGSTGSTPTVVLSWLELHPGPDRALGGPAGAELAGQVLTELLSWVRRVYLRYPDAANGLPACWLWHPEIVEELCWLSAAWRTAYAAEAPVSLAGDWHDRQRPGVVRRVRDYAGMCSIENHQPGGDLHHPAAEPPLASAADVLARWWALHRRDTPPSPTDEQVAEADRLRAQTSRGRGRR